MPGRGDASLRAPGVDEAMAAEAREADRYAEGRKTKHPMTKEEPEGRKTSDGRSVRVVNREGTLMQD